MGGRGCVFSRVGRHEEPRELEGEQGQQGQLRQQ